MKFHLSFRFFFNPNTVQIFNGQVEIGRLKTAATSLSLIRRRSTITAASGGTGTSDSRHVCTEYHPPLPDRRPSRCHSSFGGLTPSLIGSLIMALAFRPIGCPRDYLGIKLHRSFRGDVCVRTLSITLEDEVSLALSNDGMDAPSSKY